MGHSVAVMNHTPLHTFRNDEAGTTAFVNKHVDGFSVTLRDDDAGEFVPVAIIYPEEARAIAKAQHLIAHN